MWLIDMKNTLNSMVNRYRGSLQGPSRIVSGRIGDYSDELMRQVVEKETNSLDESEPTLENLQEFAESTAGFNLQELQSAAESLKKCKAPADKPTRSRCNDTETDWTVKGIQIGMGIIGAGAAIISMYYTSIWLFEILPIFFGFILALIMVSFSILAFEVVILFLSGRLNKHWTRWPIAICFLCLWILVGTFNITNTVAGQYNMHIKNTADRTESIKSDNPGRVEWQGIQDRKKEITLRMKEKREQISSLQGLYSSMGSLETRTKYGKTWNDTSRQIREAEKALDRLMKDQEIIRSDEKLLIAKYPGIIGENGEVKTASDFYGWIAGVLKKDRDIIQFLLSLVPAVFCDLVSPFSVAIFLFLRNEK